VLLGDGSLAPGQHVSLMGADGPGKAEISPTELARTRAFCDDWEQASHGGELARAVEAGLVGEKDVGRIGAVLAGAADGRRADDEITTFDSTGLALQDLAIALAAFAQVDGLELGTLSL
jgi:ornithine cyclodeaminase/alanine dehydrogenase-like protein (mu-crystallin family)